LRKFLKPIRVSRWFWGHMITIDDQSHIILPPLAGVG
jgi:hypothetical protein